jgi:DnaJ-class molecular chaperone
VAEQQTCRACEGHGSIWVSWSAHRPVTCGHCHGTGMAPAEQPRKDERERGGSLT